MTFDPLLAFFAFGVLAHVIGSDLRVPAPLYESVTIVLLLAIGLKGGVELASRPLGSLWVPMVAAVGLGVVLTLVAYGLLRLMVRLPRPDAAAVAAHYGSVSVGTFAVASAVFVHRGVGVEPFLPLLVVLLEVPAIVVAVIIARRVASTASIGIVLGDVLRSKSIVLLVGGLLIGWAVGTEGVAPIAPLFITGFKGILALFLIEMGLICGARLEALRTCGVRLAIFAIVMPVLGSVTGALLGLALGFSIGGTAMLAVLAASASYIAAPAAMRMAVPEANPALALTAALGVTFPFNVTIGIPLYLELAHWLHGAF